MSIRQNYRNIKIFLSTDLQLDGLLDLQLDGLLVCYTDCSQYTVWGMVCKYICGWIDTLSFECKIWIGVDN